MKETRRELIVKNTMKKLSAEQKMKHKDEIECMQRHKHLMATPYDFAAKYDHDIATIKVYYEHGLPYVMYKKNTGGDSSEKKLFFPSGTRKRDMKIMYASLMAEQDTESPHRYFDDEFCVEDGDIFFDIGAAEGMIALDVIDKCSKVYLFECDEKWRKPLQETFKPYEAKVEIANKFVSDVDSENTVRLEHFITENDASRSFILKIDIEGNEWTVLDSIRDILASGKYKFKITCCTYHRAEDAEKFKKYFDELGYKIRFTNRYMFITAKEFADTPSFRKGVIYATNIQDEL